jgi:hypothetical protein
VDAEAEGFAQFVEARQRALQRMAWLLTGDWALADLFDAGPTSATVNGWIDHGRLVRLTPADGSDVSWETW